MEAAQVTEPTRDAITGLPNLSSLVERIQELQALERSSRGPLHSHLSDRLLLVVSLATAPDRHTGLFLQARTAALLRSVFGDEDVIAMLRPGLFAVLVRDRADLAADRAFLASMLLEFDVDARVWTERVPLDGPTTASLFSSLLLSGDWVPD